MVNRSKAKGTDAETAWVDYLRLHGFPDAIRPALTGKNDIGDVFNIGQWVNEVKVGNKLEIPAWLKEADKEADNLGVVKRAVVVKPRGVGNARPQDFWFIVPGWLGVELMKDTL